MTSQINWPEILGKLLAKENLSRSEATWALDAIMAGQSSDAVIAAFLIALRSKGETVDELSGLVDAMLQNAIKLETGQDALDIVGTGGDMLGTVNISSMASIVVASAGIPVLKHGSRSASGKTGSAEMLEALGVGLEHDAATVSRIFDECGITFFFAPVFHPAMKHLGPIRKTLGIPTTFNFLGPLANPAQPLATSLGVANGQVAPVLAQELAARGRSGLVFRGDDGLDELTTTTTSQIWQVSGGVVTPATLNPKHFGIQYSKTEDLLGGDAKANAKIARDLFAGKTDGSLSAIRDIVLLNAAGGVVAYELAKDPSRIDVKLDDRLESALAKVSEALDSGATAAKLDAWISSSQN